MGYTGLIGRQLGWGASGGLQRGNEGRGVSVLPVWTEGARVM